MSFKHWPLVWKVTSLLLVLATAGVSGILYATHQITVIDEMDTAIIDGPANATFHLARANRNIALAVVGIYRNIVATTDEANAKAAGATKDAIAGYESETAAAARSYPGFATEMEANAGRFRSLMAGDCGEIIRLANAATTAEENAKVALEMGASCAPKLDEIVNVNIALNERLIAIKTKTNQEVSAIAAWTSRSTLIGFAVVTAGILAIAFLAVRKGMVAPIQGAMGVMGSLGRGELDVTIAGAERRDEFGAMAQSLETLRGQLREAERMRREQTAREEGERRQLARREGLANTFVGRMQNLAAGFAQSSGEVADAARNLSATAEETSRQAQAVAAAAEQAASNVQTVAASAEEMAASVREINSQVVHSAQVADTAFTEAESSNTRIGALAEAASAIGDVINLIKGIADQTNLLALNATIEAARAGEAGKGFAVVAAEVKQLANQTAKATDDIGAKVGEIQLATDGSVRSMTEIVRVIANIKDIASSIAGAVDEQGTATTEIARNCQQAATGTHQVTENISGVGHAAEMTGTASTQLMTLSDGLSGQAADLRNVVETFVRDFAAA